MARAPGRMGVGEVSPLASGDLIR
ncbi:protein of unknown function [uncultured Sphingopyxis sp.]|uniref:Uncharacterized protein n=1 Tax=uncultured Sphingopyxis sp. TaxID=310581 RepID=A0A1Y5PUW3_9SPHN|nr:protein of unknown function [uncultured Sphingopyxis sp.]